MTRFFAFLLRSSTPGTLLALAWLFPLTPLSPVAGWLSIVGFCRLIRLGSYSGLWLAGVVSHALAFYWLYFTVQDFGRFPPLAAAGIFALFVGTHSFHFPLIGLIARHLPKRGLMTIGLSTPLAWMAGEILFPRIFPWALGHTQLSFPVFAQIADVGGVALITFVMTWIAASCEESLAAQRIKPSLFLGLAAFICALFYGTGRIEEFSAENHPTQNIVVVQANISTEDKHDVRLVKTNEKRYAELTLPHQGSDSLVVWPESVIQRWIPVELGRAQADPGLQRFHGNTALLIGGLSYASQEIRHNSALAIRKDGSMPIPYHKQVLMPFGEYIPFNETFPFLQEMAAHIGGFTPGTDVTVFSYPALRTKATPEGLTASPLICYEDLLPALSRRAVKMGAKVLVNLTNDAWFGNTAALFQHHLIAAFRTIETRRPLVRSTNTGYSSIISPLGKVMGDLPPETEGTVKVSVPLLTTQTIWVTYPVETALFWLALVVLGSALVGIVLRGRSSRS